mgnify:CR=1 FL=1
MALNKELIKDIITVTSKAAISCYEFIGKNQKKFSLETVKMFKVDAEKAKYKI